MKLLFRRAALPLALMLPVAIAFPAAADTDQDCRSQVPSRVIPACTELLKSTSLTVPRRVTYLSLRSWAHTDSKAFEAAEADVNEIFKVEPNSATGYGSRGRLRHFLGQNDLALNDYNQSVALSQNKYVPLLNRGLFFVRTSNFDAARVDYEAAMQLDKAKAAPLVGRAIAHRSKNNDEAALADLDAAARLEPNYSTTYMERGELLLRIKEPKRALTDFEKAIELAPSNPRGTRGKAAALAMLSSDGSTPAPAVRLAPVATPPPVRPPAPTTPTIATPSAPPAAAPAAPPAATPAPQATPQTVSAQPVPPPAAAPQSSGAAMSPERSAQVEALMKEAGELRKTEKWKDAVAVYDRIIALEPGYHPAHYLKGQSFEDGGGLKLAFEVYSRLRGDDKVPMQIRILAAEGSTRLLGRVGDYNDAIGAANIALRLSAGSKEALFWRGLSMYRLGRYTGAIEDFRKVGAETTRGALVTGWEAMALVAQGDMAAGLDKAEAALKVNAKTTTAYVARARARLAKGDVDKADEDARQALQLAQLPEAVVTSQMIILHRLLKPTDAPLAVKRH